VNEVIGGVCPKIGGGVLRDQRSRWGIAGGNESCVMCI